jgi:sulfoxide reductase heme-binding subunit YedZ
LHQLASLLALGVVTVHILSLLGDRFIGFSIRQLLVPSVSGYQPFWMGIGIAAFYLTIVVTASFWVRKRIGNRAWKALHALSYGAFVLALAHGTFMGNDNAFWAKLLYWGTGISLALLTLWRVGEGTAHRRLRSLIAS